jgi:beta-lactamase regulating signal transducer with metallopeptidase domain
MNTLIENLFQHLQSAPFAALFLDALLKSFIVLALAGGVCALWRRASAATRHCIWFLAVASLLCLPLVSSISWQKPAWTVSTAVSSGNEISLALELAPQNPTPPAPHLQAATEVPASAPVNDGSRKIAAQFNAHWILFGWLAWLAGAMAVLARLVAGLFGRRQFSRPAQPLHDADWTILLAEACEVLQLHRPVTVLLSANDVMPMTWGWWHPVVLLPRQALQWPDARRRVVLLHELAHIKRRDYLTQIVAQLVCALYWFNPLVWLAARQMRIEREGACDDLVLAGGCKASDYAGQLVEIAGSFRRVPQMAAIAMARSSQLEGRIAAIVDASRNRRLRSAAALAVLAVIGGIAICLGGSGISAAGGSGQSDALRQRQIVQLEAFAKQKEQQSEALAAASGETILPEFQRFFDAAISGDWQTVTNLYESFKQRHPQYSRSNELADISLRTSYWAPVLEICLAYEHVAVCEPQYTQMAVDDILHSIPAGSIYFGGTDPGRGLPTAFSKSHVNADPFYTLTQNALADGAYLDYLGRMYGEQRPLLGQLADACRADDQVQTISSNWSASLARLRSSETNQNDSQWKAAVADVDALWQQRDERVKTIQAGVKQRQKTAAQDQNAPPTLYIPTVADSQKCFEDYIQEVKKRFQNHQLKPGEDVKIDGARTQISGQVAVMQVNGLLAKIIFDKNPGHEFFIEESFPLDWMYPYLEPHGLIMKINREPLSEISDAMVRQDREFWQPRVDQMIGGWLKDSTPVKAVTAFDEKVFLRHDLTGFSGDAGYVQNEYAGRMFSKFRVSIAGVYAWRAEQATDAREKKRMTKAADFAFRQALALSPHCSEAVDRYLSFLTLQHRDADARLVQAMTGRFQAANASTSAPASILQIRLALDAPTDNTEPMRVEAPAGRLGAPLYVDKAVLLGQTAVQAARLRQNPRGYEEIDVTFTEAGRTQFAEITRQHLHQRLAIVVDGTLWSAPIVQSEITDGKAQITGSFSHEEAETLLAKINEAIGK